MENTFVIGISFKNADVAVRSAFSIPEEKQNECYTLAKEYDFKDFVVLSTCNRTEIYGNGSIANAEQIITTVCNQSQTYLNTYKYIKTSDDALQHIFHVASGLDSQILGDYQILGQFKDACKVSKDNGLLGPVFQRLSNICIQASKEVKTKTELSKGTVSASYAAIEILKDKIGERPVKCLLVGTGKFGKKISKNIKHYLPYYDLTVSNRTYAKALEIAQENKCGLIKYENLTPHIQHFDVIILSSASKEFIITPENIGKGHKLILDLSIPQTVHPDCKTLEGIEVLDIDSISSILNRSLENRKVYLPIANEIIRNHIASFMDWSNFYKKRDHIVSIKNKLIEFSKLCPHLSRMDEAEKNIVVNKTIDSFVLSLKKNEKVELNDEIVLGRFLQFAQTK